MKISQKEKKKKNRIIIHKDIKKISYMFKVNNLIQSKQNSNLNNQLH